MRGGIAALLLGIAVPALAQPARAQATLPTRDVALVYRVGGAAHAAIPGGIPDTVSIAWDAARQRIRVTVPGRPQFLLVDLAPVGVRLVDAGTRSAISLPVRAKDLDPVKLQDAHLTRHGRATVAGLSCTEYAADSPRGHGTVCLTDDGVALRAVGTVNGREGSLTAVSVAYGPASPMLFEVPPGYTSLALPPGLSRLP